LATHTNPKANRQYGHRTGIVALAIALFLAPISAPAPSHAELIDRIMVIVNDDIILLSDFEKAVAPFRERLKQSGYSNARITALINSERSAILEQLITDKLTDQQARRHGIVVTEAELDDTIERIKQMQNMSDEDLLRTLQIEGLTIETYRKHLEEQMLRSRIVNREVKSRIVITEEAVNAYYEENKEQYAGETQYHLRHILMRLAAPSQEERTRVSGQMQALHARLQKGESFERLARLYSQAGTASEGGDLGLFASRLLAESVRDALQGLAPRQFTDVVETEQGYQLFYVEEVVHSGGRSLEALKSEIQEKLFAELVDQRFEDWLAALRHRAHIQIIN
jgi:peptidyl-prolyl cis-trans isomerase SurA